MTCFPVEACEPARFERPEHALDVCYQCLATSPVTPTRWFRFNLSGCCAVHARDSDTSLETYDTYMKKRDSDDEDGNDQQE